MPNRLQKTALGLAGLTALLILISIGSSRSKGPTSPIVFGNLAVPTSTNANLVSVTLTNRSNSKVVYLVFPPQVNSNGMWTGPTLPPRQRMSNLLARQSGVIMVAAASTNANTRVPILWGYNNYVPGGTRWQQLREDFLERIRGHGGTGFLYTNYLYDLKP
jgi:hypothetical protein